MIGTGLGLFGVRTRAEGLGGDCGARHNTESSTGTGTVLWFNIPYTPDPSTHYTEAVVLQTKLPVPLKTVSVEDLDISPVDLYNVLQSPMSQSAVSLIRARKLTAMVVEDTVSVRKLMERLLLQMGFASVVGYENGSKGLDALMAGTVDIVFSDVQMPIMTGPEVMTIITIHQFLITPCDKQYF